MSPRSNGPNPEPECWVTPTSLEDWKQNRASTKLDILADIVHHHLEVDNASPLSVAEDGQTLVVSPVQHGTISGKDDCDRIIIFSLFLSSNSAIQDVSQFHFPTLIRSPFTQGVIAQRDHSPRTQRSNAPTETQVRPGGVQILNSRNRFSCSHPLDGRHGRAKSGMCECYGDCGK